MIEKIKNKTGTYCGQTLPVCQDTIINKINELCDAVNGILDYAPLEMAMKAEPKVATMSKDIWHRYDEAPKHQDIIMTDTGCWAYRADLLAFETENKDLSDKIGKLETELEKTRKALDVAVDALNTIKGKHDPRCAVYHIDEKTAYDALEQIESITKGGDNE